jgi:hypothetical protein
MWREWRRIGCPKKIFTQELEGTRRRGKPREGKRGSGKRSLSARSEKMERVGERQQWKDVVRQAKAHSGL